MKRNSFYVILTITSFLLVFSNNLILAINESVVFDHIWVEDGLSQSTVFAIYKDQKDIMWFGTRRGLNMYDGYQFKHYMHDVRDSNSLSSNVIYFVIGDKKDNLIIQTDNFINYYNRYDDKFSVLNCNETFWNLIKDRENNIWACSPSGLYIFNEQRKNFDTVENQYPLNSLYDLTMDKKNNIWLTSTQGIIRYNPSDRKFKIYDLDAYPGQVKKDFFIETDGDGKIWVCLRNGELLYYNEDNDTFIKYEYDKITDNLLVSSFGRGLDNTIIVGTDGSGLIRINTKTNQSKIFNHIPDEKASLSSNTYYSIYADNKLGILWLGSYMGGVDYSSQYSKGFKIFFHEPYNKKSIINSNIRSLFVDDKNNIWIGTRQGISILDSMHNQITEFTPKNLYDAGITNPIITNIWQDPSGYIWICSYKGGVILYDLSKNKFEKVSKVYPEINLPANLGVFDVMADSKKNIWFATETGTYLFPFNKKGFVFNENFSKKIIEDRAGRIFIGSAYNGLFQVNTNTLQIFPVSFNSIGNSDKTNRINTLFEDSEGNIWIGMGGSGIIKYNPTNNLVQHFTSEDGLPDNNIAGIIEDNHSIIWVTTYSGIGRYSKDKGKFKNVPIEKGIKGKEFNPNSIEITSNGIIYSGSINGLLVFNSNIYKENPFLPEVIFTELYVNNEKVVVGQKKAPIKQTILFSDKITLKYFQNSIGLEFTAPEYYFGDKVKFYYRFGEDDEPWYNIGNNRSLNFIDLKPGEYSLTIKAENSDGYSKTEGTTLFIHVDPPPWKTKLAFSVYIALIIGLLLLLRHFSKIKLNLKYQILLQKTEKEKQTEINQARVGLFTDVSHEIGTSLTLLNVPLETLNNIEVDDIKKHYLSIINNNVKRLMHLVKRIIDLRKIETGNMPLCAEQDELTGFIKAICSNFESIARRKNISFIYDFPFEEIVTWFDKEKIEFILYNLLSNAFKFEPENGKVYIGISKESSTIKEEHRKIISIKVNNSGSIIHPDKAENIFKRFYKGSESTFGSGIGLSLAKSYVEIHKGEIGFISDSEKGVTFEVKLPFGESYLAPNEKIIAGPKYELKIPHYLDTESEISYLPAEAETGEKNKILIVEDNIELKKLLKEQLSHNYVIIEAEDGEEGLIKAKNFQPDLVVTDLIMPHGGGLELCRSIKKDFDIGHIPVIILTAKEDIEEQIKGMEAGADAYIIKPFSIYYLQSAIRNLIDLRKKLKRKYNLTRNAADEEIKISSMDENFLEKAYAILERNLDNIQFGIPEFIDQLGISKYMLYSKIKLLTGQTPNDFIITYKLKKAAHILKNKEINDMDLYYKLGFNDVSYFRKCFKKHYGMTPNQFVKSNKFAKGIS